MCALETLKAASSTIKARTWGASGCCVKVSSVFSSRDLLYNSGCNQKAIIAEETSREEKEHCERRQNSNRREIREYTSLKGKIFGALMKEGNNTEEREEDKIKVRMSENISRNHLINK